MRVLKKYLVLFQSSVILFLAPTGHCQDTSQDVFTPIPTQIRAKFIDGLNKQIEFHQKQMWAEVYEMLFKREGLSKDEYVNREIERRRKSTNMLLRFTAKRVQHRKDGLWAVYGCGEWRLQQKAEKRLTVVLAKLQKGEWYFSQIAIVLMKEEDPCAAGGV